MLQAANMLQAAVYPQLRGTTNAQKGILKASIPRKPDKAHEDHWILFISTTAPKHGNGYPTQADAKPDAKWSPWIPKATWAVRLKVCTVVRRGQEKLGNVHCGKEGAGEAEECALW